MTSQFLLTFLVALAFAGVHAAGPLLDFLRTSPRSVWLSASGGVSVAYVFIHMMPDLADYQATFHRELQGTAGFLASIELHSYLISLFGLVTFYGLHRMARVSSRQQAEAGAAPQPSPGVYRINLAAYALYNVLIGYLLVHREEMDLRGLAIYAVAMGLHFVLNDQALREEHGDTYDRHGRWLLAAAPLAGWALGLAVTLHPLAISALFAFLIGGVILNVLKEELPEDRESRFGAFAGGALAYAALLIVTR